MHDCQDIGPHYAVTLRAWRAAWEARKAEVLKLGYSERFWRKYRYEQMLMKQRLQSQWFCQSACASCIATQAGVPDAPDAACFSALCRFYFAYCEAAFDERYIHTFQVLWVKGAEPRNSMAAPAGATLAEAVAEPSRRPSSPDPMTQVLLPRV